MDPLLITRIWLLVKPWRRIKQARNRRRARLGKPLLTISEADDMLFPQGTMTKTGAGIAVLGPVVTAVLQAFGIGECTPEAIAMGCLGASQFSGIAISILGGVIAWLGRNRAEKRMVAGEPSQPS